MDHLKFEQAPKDLLDQLEKMIRNLPKEDQFELYKELKSRAGDQRKSLRKDFYKNIFFTSSRGAHNEFTKDVSEDGVFIETPIFFELGENVTISFPLNTKNNEFVRLYGEIVRKDEIGVGIKFHPIDKTKSKLLKKLLISL